MPVPAVGFFVASLPLIYWNVNEETIRSFIGKQMVFVRPGAGTFPVNGFYITVNGVEV